MRELRVAPRLWWGFWVVVSAWLLGACGSVFISAVGGLPYDHLSNTLAATVSFYVTILQAAAVYHAGLAFLFPPQQGEDDEAEPVSDA